MRRVVGRPYALLRLGFSLAAALGFALGALPSVAQPSDVAVGAEEDLFADEPLADEDLFADELVADEELPAEELVDNTEAGLTAEDRLGDAAQGSTVDGRAGDGGDPTPAQSDTPSADVEEILVQGKAGPGIEVDAAVSVTSFDAGDLQAMGVEDVSDLAKFTPNLEIRTVGSTAATFFIRGVGLNDFTANAAGSVAVYQDDVALNLPAIQTGQIFDVEGVEVLKGPQGWGPGRNASAGVIRVHSRRPKGETGGTVRVDYGNFDYVDLEGGLEVPVYADVLSSRVAFRLTQRDGLVKNRCGGLSQAQIDAAGGRPCANNLPSPGNPGVVPGLPRKFNDIDTWAARAQFRFLPTDTDMDWLLNLHGGAVDQSATVGSAIGASGFFGGPSSDSYTQPEIARELGTIIDKLGGLVPRCRQDPVCAARLERGRAILGRRLASGRPLDTKPFKGDYNLPGYERQDTLGGFLRGEWELENVSLTAISSYDKYDRERLVDADYTSNRNFEFDTRDDAWQFSQDLRLSGTLDSLPLEWSAGAYYLMEELDFYQMTLVGAGNEIQPLTQAYEQKTWSFAAYAGFVWNFLDDFELEGGVRYNWEKKNFDAFVSRGASNKCESRLIPGSGLFTLAGDCTERVTVGDPTGSVSIKYFLAEDLSAYLKYSRGWKSAQVNIGDGFDNLNYTTADPESIDAFEAGFHGSWFDGRLDLGGALFWYSYQDYQVFLFTNDFGSPPQRVVRNASDAQIYGAELEAHAEPIEALLLTARFSWLESKFLDFTDSGVRSINLGIDSDPPVIFTDVPIEYTGNRLPNTPRYTLSGSVEYALDLGRYGSLIPRYDFSWTDDVFFDPSEGRGAPNVVGDLFLPDYAIGQKAYALHNVRLAYQTPQGNVEVAGWVRNVANEVYKTLAFDASTAAGLVGNLVGDPRTYGISVSVSF